MLTIPKLQLLIKYHWQGDLLAQKASVQEKELMMGLDWHDLADMLQDLKLYHQQLLSKDYARQLHSRLFAACADEATVQTFIGYASTL